MGSPDGAGSYREHRRIAGRSRLLQRAEAIFVGGGSVPRAPGCGCAALGAARESVSPFAERKTTFPECRLRPARYRTAAASFATAASSPGSSSDERIKASSLHSGNKGHRTHSFQIRAGSSDFSIG